MRGLRARQPSTTGIHGGTQDNATAGAQQANARTHAGALGATPGEVAQPPHAMEYAQPAPDGAEGPTAENNIDLVLRPYRMDAITRPFDGPPLAVPSARGAGERPYVLPKGASWYGVQVELASTDYHWNGPSGETRALNNSESWGGRKGIGVVYGRDWQSGFGFEVAGTWSKVRSNLFYAEQGPQVVHNTTDTTWTGTPMGQHTIYTWNIVTTSVAEPGPSRTYSAVNTYTMLRFDALASYQRPLGRWTAVLRAGPTLTLFPGHEGNTLVAGTTGSEPASGMMTAVPLSAASVKDRFAPQLGLLAGFDLRYSLSERFMLGMGPTFLTTLGGEEVRNARLNCTEWGGTLRLIYRPAPHERRGR